jgi:intraflagellar transport protein 122
MCTHEQEPNANSVAWNSDNGDLLCYSGSGVLCIKAAHFASHQQRMQGFVVGFAGKRVFCLHMYAMTSLEVPLSNQMYQYLQAGMYG